MEYASYSLTSCPCWWRADWGQGWVGCLLHHEEERRSMLCTPLCASSPPRNGVPNVLLLVLYIASRLRGVRVCAPSQRASPPHNGVRSLLVLDEDVGGHNEKGWLVWQLHDNNEIVLEIFVPSDLWYWSWGGRFWWLYLIFLHFLIIFFNIFFLCRILITNFLNKQMRYYGMV